ncbi:MAG: UDP-N-acetylmuramoyl-L-alanine--D-glutamate ligase [Gemmatimonadales bacterium]
MKPVVNGEVAVVGLARTGRAITRWLAQNDYVVYASDCAQGDELHRTAEALSQLDGVTAEVGRHDMTRLAAAALVVASPGVPPDAEPLRAARNAGVPIQAELDVAAQVLDAVDLAVVTGTNGKTTTAVLAHLIVDAAGLDVALAGNIGAPLIDVALEDRPPRWAIVEASSFQLHDCHELTPAIGAVTSLSPDHLDRYASVDAYYEDKRRLFRNSDESSCWILPHGDSGVTRLAEGALGDRLTFGTTPEADAYFDGRQLFLGSDVLIERAGFQLLGDHNVMNALAASLIASRIGVSGEQIAAALCTARPLPNRLEVIGNQLGKTWINDSKATNVASTKVAIAAMHTTYALLLGGKHKGEPYTSLGDVIDRNRCQGVFAFGEAAPFVAEDLAELGVATVDDLASAVRAAAGTTADTVLLSPACSSFDQFDNYEHRGRVFRSFVKDL